MRRLRYLIEHWRFHLWLWWFKRKSIQRAQIAPGEIIQKGQFVYWNDKGQITRGGL